VKFEVKFKVNAKFATVLPLLSRELFARTGKHFMRHGQEVGDKRTGVILSPRNSVMQGRLRRVQSPKGDALYPAHLLLARHNRNAHTSRNKAKQRLRPARLLDAAKAGDGDPGLLSFPLLPHLSGFTVPRMYKNTISVK
jgi:hypothetical protein